MGKTCNDYSACGRRISAMRSVALRMHNWDIDGEAKFKVHSHSSIHFQNCPQNSEKRINEQEECGRKAIGSGQFHLFDNCDLCFLLERHLPCSIGNA
ncbi:unnamed protein product [Cercopithifilaria johnstoni]|uniref:Uncharacterized protein n=1 Tax=Cercopithifilaria johnstoni TaxID=2874296 RepID=A0A8J2PZK0_9BILA|nr:unnamed protein product [Cercopithifilaria johnstoni]